jgi:hypothetical protein
LLVLTVRYLSLSHYILDEDGDIQSSSNLVRDFKLYLLDILIVWRFHRGLLLFPSLWTVARVAAEKNIHFVSATTVKLTLLAALALVPERCMHALAALFTLCHRTSCFLDPSFLSIVLPGHSSESSFT